MTMRNLFGISLLLGYGVYAQQVHVRGKVSDGTGKAVPNAIVQLVKAGLKDTTGPDGAFSMTSIGTALRRSNQPRTGDIEFQRGILDLTLEEPSQVKIEIFDVKGNLSHREILPEAGAGNFRVDLRGKLPSNGLSMVRATFGRTAQAFQCLALSSEGDADLSMAAPVQDGPKLAKTSAAVDSLKATATGLSTSTIPLGKLDTTVNITLSAGPSKTSPGCASSSPLKSGNFTETINGTARKWIVDVPANYDPGKPYRLIFVWHPMGGSGSQVASGGYNGLKTLSNGTAIFATADGLQGVTPSGSRGTGWFNVDGGDMKLVQAMLDKINGGLCVDQERIFSTGFSFGGMMSYTLPFEFDVFRAVAPCSGKIGIIPYTVKFTRPIPIMAFHGDADDVAETELGREFFDVYLKRNQCGAQTQAVTPAPCIQYQGCPVQTTWCLFKGGHSTWSEEPAAIWKFFSQF